MIDQLYLSLRISSINELTTENRLENVLKYLHENYEDKQIIILTCTNREEEALDSTGITYNKIII